MMPAAAKPLFVVDPNFPNSKEVLSIPRRYRLAAMGAWEAAGCWSCDKLTDGWVPVNALRELLVTPLLAELLITSTLWLPVTCDGPSPDAWLTYVGPTSAVQFDNWPKWQKTKEEWLRGRTSNAQRQQRFRNSRSNGNHADASRDDNALPDDAGTPPSNPAKSGHNALVTRQSSKEEQRYLGGGGTDTLVNANGGGPPPPSSCSRHPHGTPDACPWCEQNRIAHEAAARQHDDVESVKRVADRDRLRRCTDCDPNGLRYVDPFDTDNSDLVRCNHPAVP